MPSPSQQQTISLFIPPGESQVQYPVDSLAREIVNLSFTAELTLRAIRGPALWEPVRVAGQNPAYRSETIHSVFHARLNSGKADMLIVRWGSKLYWHTGWSRTFSELGYIGVPAGNADVSDDTRASYPDQYVVVNDKIIWTNGVDRARIITYEGVAMPLGFDSPAPRPRAIGPVARGPGVNAAFAAADLTIADNGDSAISDQQQEPNAFGYSWPGRVGTVGDVLDGETGAVRAGEFVYWAQLESLTGDLSPLSGESNPIVTRTATASPAGLNGRMRPAQVFRRAASAANPPEPMNVPDVDNTNLEDLLKQFAAGVDGDTPGHTRAIHIFRSADRKNGGGPPRRVARVPGRRAAMVPDNTPDGYLGGETVNPRPVPVFRVACAHQGRLIIGNIPGDPGLVMRSLPGMPGTFEELEYVYPDSGGAEITALVSHGGSLYAFTEDTTYSLDDFGAPTVVAQGVGCVAPRSLAAMPDGSLVWLGRESFYIMRDGGVAPLSQPIDRLLENSVNRARMRRAVAAYSYESREYQCSLAPAGSTRNSLTLCFGTGGWRRRELGLDVRDTCTLKDARKYTLLAAREVDNLGTTNDVYVADREHRAYTPPTRTVKYKSNWLRASDTAALPVQVSEMYVGMLDEYNGPLTVKFYKNGSWQPVHTMTDLLAVGPDSGSTIVTQAAGSAVVGTAKALDPRLFWRRIPVKLQDARIWAFSIEVEYPGRMHLAAVAFDVAVATGGNKFARIPLRGDT